MSDAGQTSRNCPTFSLSLALEITIMAELDAAAMEQLRKEMGEKVEIPVPEGMIPVHDNKATAVLAAPGDLERLRESMAQELVMSTLAGELAVVRLPPDAAVPYWANDGIFCSITRTPYELSIVTDFAAASAAERREGPWTAFMVHGPLDFALTGILSKISGALANAGVSIFAISTFDTDYVLVPSADAERARSALAASGTCRFADA